jgi:hypothetical protein
VQAPCIMGLRNNSYALYPGTEGVTNNLSITSNIHGVHYHYQALRLSLRPVLMGFHQSFMSINYANVTPY